MPKISEIEAKPENATQLMLILQFFLSFVMGFTANSFVSMINSLQITAHLPLNNVPYVYPSRETFETLIAFVSFDILPGEAIEAMNMTPTDYWSAEFEFLGYDSCNFLELMGSLGIFAAILLIQIVFSPLMWLVARKYPDTEAFMGRWKMGSVFAALVPMTVWLGTQAFLMESYMELVIACMLSSQMLLIREIWTFQDKIAFGFNVVFSIATIAFTFFIIWFVFKKVNGLVAVRKLEFVDKNKDFFATVRDEYNTK